MSRFDVKVVRVDDVIDHPNADRLTVVKIGGYTCIANKREDGSWRYQKGDLVVYIPSASVLPEWLLQKMGFWKDGKGTLGGPDGNRVGPMKLRGVYSEGVLYPVTTEVYTMVGRFSTDGINEDWTSVQEGDDVGEFLGITKWEPAIPKELDGKMFTAFGYTTDIDIEPIEKYQDVLDWIDTVTVKDTPQYKALHQDYPGLDEYADRPLEVELTEKCHGISMIVSVIAGMDDPNAYIGPGGKRNVLIYPKRLGHKGIVFMDCPENDTSIYVKAFKENFHDFFAHFGGEDVKRDVHILGEVFGRGVQDLHYGQEKPVFRVFDIRFGEDSVTPGERSMFCEMFGLQEVPVLYRGPLTREILVQHRDGKDSISGTHVREGVVIRMMDSISHPIHGRVWFKAVSPDYKLRKNGTEYT